jgi:hypothetical protein
MQVSVLTFYTSDGIKARLVAARRFVTVNVHSSVSVASEMLEFVLKRRPTVSKVRSQFDSTADKNDGSESPKCPVSGVRHLMQF